MAWAIALATTLCTVALAVAGLSVYGARRWSGDMRALRTELDAGRGDGSRDADSPTHYDVRELDGLPAPVQRYFRAALADGQPIIAAVTIDMTGTFNMSPTGEQWKHFTSRQRVVTRRPGFLWDAAIRIAPGVNVRVVDSYIAGIGRLRAAVQGFFVMADLRGDGDIARGELMRWIAEVAWYPTALLPSQGVRWEAVDDGSARATVIDGALHVALLFRFDQTGLIGSFRADARGNMVGKAMVMAPWEGAWSNYQVRDGMQIPLTGEVAWMRPEGRRPYFVGTVTAVGFEFRP